MGGSLLRIKIVGACSLAVLSSQLCVYQEKNSLYSARDDCDNALNVIAMDHKLQFLQYFF